MTRANYFRHIGRMLRQQGLRAASTLSKASVKAKFNDDRAELVEEVFAG
jgi:hypothetical protein